jgi:hypothetical protein
MYTSLMEALLVLTRVHSYDESSMPFQYDGTSTAHVLNAKARALYLLALAALQISNYSDGVLLTVLLNNTGSLLHQHQCMMSEVTIYFRAVCDLMNACDNAKTLFNKSDYCGLYLNSLISSDTASAA